MKKNIKFACFLFVSTALIFAAAPAYSQSHDACITACTREIPKCIDGHSELYASGIVNECTLRAEVYCLQKIQDENIRLKAENFELKKELVRLYRLLRIGKLYFR